MADVDFSATKTLKGIDITNYVHYWKHFNTKQCGSVADLSDQFTKRSISDQYVPSEGYAQNLIKLMNHDRAINNIDGVAVYTRVNNKDNIHIVHSKSKK
jgi:hypothetical protein